MTGLLEKLKDAENITTKRINAMRDNKGYDGLDENISDALDLLLTNQATILRALRECLATSI